MLSEIGRNQEAVAEIDKALKLHAHAPEEYDDLCSRMRIDAAMNDWKSLVRDASRRLEFMRGDQVEVLQKRGDAYLQLGQWDSAIPDYLAVLKITPKSRKTLQGLLEAYEKKGTKKEADAIRKMMSQTSSGL